MKTRIVKTKFWDDPKTLKLHPDARSFFMYLLTNRFVGLTCYYELDDAQMMLHLGWDKKKLEKAKLELSKHKRAFFYDGWVFIPNLDRHNPYWKSPKTKLAYERELKNVPKHIIDVFKRQLDSTIDSTMHSTTIVDIKHKKENINNKTNNTKRVEYTTIQSIDREVIKEIAKQYEVSFKFVALQFEKMKNWCESKGKRYKNYKRALQNWVLRAIEQNGGRVQIRLGEKPKPKVAIKKVIKTAPPERVEEYKKQINKILRRKL